MNFIDAVVNVDSVDSLGTPKMVCRGPGIGPNATGILNCFFSYETEVCVWGEGHTASTLMDSSPMSIFEAPV